MFSLIVFFEGRKSNARDLTFIKSQTFYYHLYQAILLICCMIYFPITNLLYFLK